MDKPKSADEMLEALIERSSPTMQERLRKYRAEMEIKQRESVARLEEYCGVIGIEYTGDEKQTADAIKIAEAAEISATCASCTRCVMDALKCDVCEKRENTFLNSFVTPCEKYHQAKRILARGREQERLLNQSGLGKRFASRRFETFDVTAGTRAAYNACVEFCDGYTQDSRGIRLIGSYGSGKTHLAAAIVHRMAEQGIGGMFVVVPELLRAIRRGYNSQSADADKLVNIAETSPLLVLDDLGAEKPSDWVSEQLYVIINRRYENMLPTIITTNCTTQELVERIGQRTVSRIIEMTTTVKLTAKDYRMSAG